MSPDSDAVLQSEHASIQRALSVWSPGPSTLAFFATLVLLGAFTRVGLFTPYGAASYVLDEMRVVVPVMVAAVALAHALVVAAASRARSLPVALVALLAGTATLPLLAQILRPLLHELLAVVSPAFCDASPSCPPEVWSPLIGLLVGALLSPIVITAVRLRAERAYDAPARMLWITGFWTALLTVPLCGARLAHGAPLMLAWAVSGACMLAGLVDTLRRSLRLRRLLAHGGAVVTGARAGDPAGLRPYASVSGRAAHDAVLRVGDAASLGPYRDGRAGFALALVPANVSIVRAVLSTRWKRQCLGIVGVTATVACAAMLSRT